MRTNEMSQEEFAREGVEREVAGFVSLAPVPARQELSPRPARAPLRLAQGASARTARSGRDDLPLLSPPLDAEEQVEPQVVQVEEGAVVPAGGEVRDKRRAWERYRAETWVDLSRPPYCCVFGGGTISAISGDLGCDISPPSLPHTGNRRLPAVPEGARGGDVAATVVAFCAEAEARRARQGDLRWYGADTLAEGRSPTEKVPPPAQGRGRGVGRRARGEAYHARRVDSVQLPGALSSSTRPAVSVRSTLWARPAARSKTASAAPHAWRPSRKALSTASTKSGRSTKKSTSCAMLWSVKMSTSVAIIPRSPGILKMVCLSSRTAFGSLGRVVDGDARATS